MSLILLLALSAHAQEPALAGAWQPDPLAPYVHALNTPSANLAIDDLFALGLTTDEVLSELHTYVSIEVDASGTETLTATAEPRNIWVDPNAPVAGPPSIFMDDRTSQLLQTPSLLQGAPVEVQVRLQTFTSGSTALDHVRAGIVDGVVQTYGDVDVERGLWSDTRTADFNAAFDAVLASQPPGVEVLERNTAAGLLRVSMPSDQLAWLASADGVVDIWTQGDGEVETMLDSNPGQTMPVYLERMTGPELLDLMQANHFHSRGYEGMFGSLPLAYIEGAVETSHRAFDSWGSYGPRVANCSHFSDAMGCQINLPSAVLSGHATKGMGMALQNISDGEDPAYPAGSQSALERSFVAPEAFSWAIDLHAYGPKGPSTTWITERVGKGDPVATTRANVATTSQSIYFCHGTEETVEGKKECVDRRYHCSGGADLDQWTHGLFDHDVAFFKSASNGANKAEVTTACSIGHPGATTSTFTVGETYVHNLGGVDAELRVSDATSIGGYDGRSIVDIAAPSRTHFAAWTDPENPGSHYGDFGNTSGSTPVVAGGALLFREWFTGVVGSEIDDPGVLYANLLLMGNRLASDGTLLTTGYDNRLGAGSLELRTFDALGTDGVSKWQTGYVCVPTVGHAYVDIGFVVGEPDVLRAVTWTHQPNVHESELRRTLSLEVTGSDFSGTWSTIDASADTKHRVHIDDPADGWYTMKITQSAQYHHNHIDCTSQDIYGSKVYYAYLYEQSTRAPSEGLHEVRPW